MPSPPPEISHRLVRDSSPIVITARGRAAIGGVPYSGGGQCVTGAQPAEELYIPTRLPRSSESKTGGMLRSCLLSRSYQRLESAVRYTSYAGAMKALSRRVAVHQAETGRPGAAARRADNCGSTVASLNGRGHG